MILRGAIFIARRIRWWIGGVWGRAVLRSYGVRFKKGLQLGSAPIIRRKPGAIIALGSGVVITNTLAENPAGITHRTVLAADKPSAEILIGNDVRMSGVVLYAWKRIEIRDGVLLGVGAAIYDTDFHSLDPEQRRNTDTDAHSAKVASVLVERDVWVGAHALVLKGVTIGARAIVAAGAIVTSDVPSGAIVVGSPARVVGWVRG